MQPVLPADLPGYPHPLYDHLPAGVVVHAADGRILSSNRLAQELLGRSEAVLRDDGSAMPADEFPVSVVLRTGEKLSGLLVGMAGPGPTNWLLCNAYPEFDDSGCVRQVVVCFTDCTALKNTRVASTSNSGCATATAITRRCCRVVSCCATRAARPCASPA